MTDPTYIKAEIEKNPVWELAFFLSEVKNDNAPIGWSKYIGLANSILYHYTVKRKEKVE